MQRDLAASAAQLQWIIEGYSLFVSALILLGGALSDRFGRRAVFALGIAIFTAASFVCALAPTIDLLLIARCVQGVGGALATPGSLALISAFFSDDDRARAIGTWSGVSAMMSALGPVLGGWLTQSFSWRSVFALNVPLGVIVVAVCVLRVPESRDESAAHDIDVVGSALVTFGLGSLVYGLIALQGTGGAMPAWSAIAAGALMLIGFALYERFGTREPMLRPDLFRSGAFSGANLYTLLLYAALSGSLYFVPFDLINVQGYSPLGAGAALLPFVAIMALASRWSGGLVKRIGARTPLVVGALVAALGFVAFALPGIGGSYWATFFPAATLLGIGAALFVTPLTTVTMNAVDVADVGIASGINNVVSRVAGLVAIAALGFALAATFSARLGPELAHAGVSPSVSREVERERDQILSGVALDGTIHAADRDRATPAIQLAYVAGFRRTMEIAAALALGAAIVAMFGDLRSPRERTAGA